ncbi:MAG: tRNA-(ms[2]io[6]A)-hydroxylase [Planctomycetota bacterium]|jgi:tRNA-(ms[2]io[6]A)-hydroxylase
MSSETLGGRPVFRLAYQTPSSWAAMALQDPLALLSDHAHCELKAAITAQALVAKNPEHSSILHSLPRVAIEELEHFERVVQILEERGGKLEPQASSPYADGLHKGSAGTRNNLLLDRLLLAHLIEARSLERFHLLSKEDGDTELQELYSDLLVSEASHRALFINLARELFPLDKVTTREGFLRELEGRVIEGLAPSSRVHSGPPA